MSAWITDRVPTREDGDNGAGYVLCAGNIMTIPMVWSRVNIGRPWQRYPEPYVKPKKWAVFESFKKDSVFLAKDGKHVIGLSPFTYEEITAMTDALNKLEDSHD